MSTRFHCRSRVMRTPMPRTRLTRTLPCSSRYVATLPPTAAPPAASRCVACADSASSAAAAPLTTPSKPLLP
ncbi:hypothetical protein CLOP_g10151 [Closterium sp. NIES-67]|nr:hypothetical protein CLOP_g10151 [Closterium sp. NIES-67]